jgi:hypothetical protein
LFDFFLGGESAEGETEGGEGSFFWVAHIEEDVGGFEGAGRAGGTERGDEF